jgi:hypothetical protein
LTFGFYFVVETFEFGHSAIAAGANGVVHPWPKGFRQEDGFVAVQPAEDTFGTALHVTKVIQAVSQFENASPRITGGEILSINTLSLIPSLAMMFMSF